MLPAVTAKFTAKASAPLLYTRLYAAELENGSDYQNGQVRVVCESAKPSTAKVTKVYEGDPGK